MKRIFHYFICVFVIHLSCKNINSDAEKMLTFLPNDNSPKVLSAIPGMGDKGLPRTQKISILFDRPMSINTCVQSFSISPATQGFYELNDYSLVFTPSTQWNYGTYTYTLTKNCESKEGNDLKEVYSASFTIGETTVAGSFPEISSVLIATGSVNDCNNGGSTQENILSKALTNVCMGSPNTNAITFNFSRPMDRAATATAIAFSPSFSASFTWASDTTLVVLPDAPFLFNARISFNISTQAQDTQGVKLQIPASGSFFVGTGNLVPVVSSLVISADTLANCLNGVGVTADLVTTSVNNGCMGNPNTNTFTITFSRSMNRIQTQSNVIFSPSLTGTYTWSANNQVLTFVPDARLNYGTRYTITIGTGAVSTDRIFVDGSSIYSFTAGGPVNNAPTVQAVGVASQGCATTLPGTGSATGGNWLAGTCFWDNSLSILGPSSYQFRAGDTGGGNCADVNTDNFRLIFSNYMDLNSTINAIRLRRLSPPSTVVQLSTWTWSDCQAVFPFGCRVVDLVFAELESSCNGTTAFGNAGTGGDFNLLQSNTAPAGYPYYMISVDTTAKDVNNVSFPSTFNFSMEAK
ncbi:Ig-like domain-containing protein [Leptospira ryugenii]|uniref:Ig-like domain-containing protein n=1 Tax=Leptospira ryugenii TaxID=1917863 RepID=UPI000D598353|nr:Ig-like domain-containing protein [Leptospira ryugenii]